MMVYDNLFFNSMIDGNIEENRQDLSVIDARTKQHSFPYPEQADELSVMSRKGSRATLLRLSSLLCQPLVNIDPENTQIGPAIYQSIARTAHEIVDGYPVTEWRNLSDALSGLSDVMPRIPAWTELDPSFKFPDEDGSEEDHYSWLQRTFPDSASIKIIPSVMKGSLSVYTDSMIFFARLLEPEIGLQRITRSLKEFGLPADIIKGLLEGYRQRLFFFNDDRADHLRTIVLNKPQQA